MPTYGIQRSKQRVETYSTLRAENTPYELPYDRSASNASLTYKFLHPPLSTAKKFLQ